MCLGLTALSTQCIGYITMGSVKGKGNQYILAGQDSACKLLDIRKQTTMFPT